MRRLMNWLWHRMFHPVDPPTVHVRSRRHEALSLEQRAERAKRRMDMEIGIIRRETTA